MCCAWYQLCKIQFTGFYDSGTFSIATSRYFTLHRHIANTALYSHLCFTQMLFHLSLYCANCTLHIVSLPDWVFLSRGRKDLSSGSTFSVVWHHFTWRFLSWKSLSRWAMAGEGSPSVSVWCLSWLSIGLASLNKIFLLGFLTVSREKNGNVSYVGVLVDSWHQYTSLSFLKFLQSTETPWTTCWLAETNALKSVP